MHTVIKTKSPIFLRPHHGMCLAYFEGKGYSNNFSAHMQKILELLTAPADSIHEKQAKKKSVCLVTHTDIICSACPNNISGVCRESEKVLKYDRAVLELCGLKDGQTMMFDEFAALVETHILSAGKRAEICGGCQWESICANRKSRWEGSKPPIIPTEPLT